MLKPTSPNFSTDAKQAKSKLQAIFSEDWQSDSKTMHGSVRTKNSKNNLEKKRVGELIIILQPKANQECVVLLVSREIKYIHLLGVK